MARARNIKPGFFTNDDLVELPFATRLLFIGLWTIADRAGRLLDRPKKIKMDVFPGDDVDVDEALSHLAHRGFILRYVAGDTPAIQICNWDKHQNPHVKEAKSTILAPGQVRLNPEEAQVEHGASTVQEPEKEVPAPEIPERAGLIPDSGFLIPDSGFPQEQASQPEQAPEAKPAKTARASRLPPSWEPSPEDIAYCRTERPDLDPDRVAENFRDYWHAKAGKDACKLDWSATWRTWVRNEKSQTAPRVAPHRPYQTATDKARAWADNLIGRNRDERADANIIDINPAPLLG
jgi:hypothetical protein